MQQVGPARAEAQKGPDPRNQKSSLMALGEEGAPVLQVVDAVAAAVSVV